MQIIANAPHEWYQQCFLLSCGAKLLNFGAFEASFFCWVESVRDCAALGRYQVHDIQM